MHSSVCHLRKSGPDPGETLASVVPVDWVDTDTSASTEISDC